VCRILFYYRRVNSFFALTVALALREQVLDGGQVPMGEYDWKVDMIVTPDEIIGVRL